MRRREASSVDGQVMSGSSGISANAKQLQSVVDDIADQNGHRTVGFMYGITVALVIAIWCAFGVDPASISATAVVLAVTILTDLRLKQLVSRLDQYRALIGDIESHQDSESLKAVWHYTTNAKKYVMISLWAFIMCGIDILGIIAIGAAFLIH